MLYRTMAELDDNSIRNELRRKDEALKQMNIKINNLTLSEQNHIRFNALSKYLVSQSRFDDLKQIYEDESFAADLMKELDL